MPNWGGKKKKTDKGKSPQLFHSLLIKLKIKATCELTMRGSSLLPHTPQREPILIISIWVFLVFLNNMFMPQFPDFLF